MIPKKGGGKRRQRVKVLKSGKYKFLKNPLSWGKKSSTKKSSKKTKKRSVRRTGKKKKRGRRGFNPQSLFKWIRLGALVAPAAATVMEHPGDPYRMVEHGLYRYTGYSMERHVWEPNALIEGWGAFLGACVATYGIPKLTSILRRL